MKLTTLLLLLASGAAFAATEENINKTFPALPGGKLVVHVDFGSIDVSTNSRGGEVTVDVWRNVTRKSKDDEEQFLRGNPVVFQHESNTLTIRSQSKEKKRWFSGWRNRIEAKYTIRVPAQFNTKLDTSGGGIAVSDLTGEVNADSSGGGIQVTDCEGTIKVNTSGGGIDVAGGGGSLEADCSGGRIAVKTFNGPVSVATSGGGVTINSVRGKVKGETSGGSINVVLLSPVPGDIWLSTSGGGVTVNLPGDAAFNLNAETSGGGVSCELPVTIEGKKERNELKGAVNGGGPTLRLESSGGGIHVNKL